MRREFQLSKDDTLYLDSLGLQWETIRNSNNENGVIIYDYILPEGYTATKVNILLRIEATYPDTEIDMVYFSPDLHRNDGKTIPNADQYQDFNGVRWQRWSRHRTQQNHWRIGLDGIDTHMGLVKWWLERELRK